MAGLADLLNRPGRVQVGGAPAGYDALLLARLAAARGEQAPILFIARDDTRMAVLAEALAFFDPTLEVLTFPAWDCLPYDRVSPNSEIVAHRIDTLTRLLEPPAAGRRRIVVATVSAVLQRVPGRSFFTGTTRRLAAGDRVDPRELTTFLLARGYGRADTVMEAGEFAVRGGIVDLFPPGAAEPLRLDFFGDELERIRAFDPVGQRTTGERAVAVLKAVSEAVLEPAAIERFRTGYRDLFGAVGGDDPLYEAVSAGRKHIGMEHWLPLFHASLETLFDYLPEAAVLLDHQAEEARDARLELIDEYYEARRGVGAAGGLAAEGGVYNPLPPGRLYLDADELDGLLASRPVGLLSPFAVPEAADSMDAAGRPGRDFADARAQPDVNLFEALRSHIAGEQAAGRRVVLTVWTIGTRDRLAGVMREHGLPNLSTPATWAATGALPRDEVALVVLGLERGFVTSDLAVIAEQDILGERLSRPARRRVRPENFIAEASALAEGDLVVHVDHGIGRYEGLETVQAGGAAHDCLRVVYDGGDKLYVPVENIEVLSRYGSEQAGAQLDRLGGAAWQARKARLKSRIRDMAERLIAVAAQRTIKPAAAALPPEGMFDEFCARFPYVETDDQQKAIQDTLDDLASGRPMDRLVCGDVGFGKTEVALRAAFVAALSGRQVAVAVPTTLLCRQHFQTFRQRFAGLPVRIEQLSRLVTAKKAREIKDGLTAGAVDIVIGTHALLAKDIRFKDLGLLVVDEEQHFGVAHKERLKELKADVHVLTLTATPIPRTLQLALSGVREMSVMATPPVDRLAVRTFILPFDPVVIREAIMREHFRGGQTFYVCPRIEDLPKVAERLGALVPECKMAIAHGQMSSRELEKAMTAFYEGACDILLCTQIIESGLDMPRVNTIVIHRADMFGLAQLYQLRGRVGRSKVRAYAYLTLPPRQKLSAAAERRLQVMQSLDSLGAGFMLASHDLDIRGAGNLLGEEQSGHIREVGIELYQQMLEEAVAEARGAVHAAPAEEWTPQIGIGMAVLIPETYVPDLSLRLALYRRLAGLATAEEIEAFAVEMIDRFGPVPPEVENLLQTVTIKLLCKEAGVDRVEAGPKGALVGFRNNVFANPAGLVAFIHQESGTARLRSDHRLVLTREWTEPRCRLEGVRHLLRRLIEVGRAGA